jgi:transcriptional regulator with XRE-family HTH domain
VIGVQRSAVAIAFGDVLRELRQQRGLTQEGLAAVGGFHRTYPSLLERGLRTPSLCVLFQLADSLGVSAPSIMQMTSERLNNERP